MHYTSWYNALHCIAHHDVMHFNCNVRQWVVSSVAYHTFDCTLHVQHSTIVDDTVFCCIELNYFHCKLQSVSLFFTALFIAQFIALLLTALCAGTVDRAWRWHLGSKPAFFSLKTIVLACSSWSSKLCYHAPRDHQNCALACSSWSSKLCSSMLLMIFKIVL